jgi:subtilisin family serine protease
MRAKILIIFIFLFLALILHFSYASDSDYVNVVVHYKDMHESALVHESAGFARLRAYSEMNAAEGRMSRSDMEKLRKDPAVESVEYNPTVTASLADVIQIINAAAVHRSLSGNFPVVGAGETVCLIDSGVNYTHPDLGGCIITADINDGSCKKVIGGHNFCADDNCIAENDNPMDNNGHGTHVAGIVAANGSDVEAAIRWCVNRSSVLNISVISMSLGTTDEMYVNSCDNETFYASLADAVNTAVMNNISVLAASGNSGNITAVSAPACLSSVIAVAASTKTDGMAGFSNRNPHVFLIAPGTNVNSTDRNGGYSIKSGTSMATPAVAGAFTLLRSYERQESGIKLKPLDMAQILNETGKKIFDAASNRIYSRVNVLAAVTKLDNTSPVLNISSPRNMSFAGSNVPVNFTYSDNMAVDKCWVVMGNTTFYGCFNRTINASEGRNIAFVFVNDTNGNVNYSSVEFIVDTKKPEISLQSPLNTTYNKMNTSLNLQVNDQNLDRCYYSLNGGPNVMISGCANITFTAIPGVNRLFIYVNDTAGNTNSANVAFSVAIAGPTIVINYPYNQTYPSAPSLNISVFSSITTYCWYELNNVTIQNPSCGNVSSIGAENYNKLVVHVNDSLGRNSSAAVNFTIDSAPPSLWFSGPKNETINSSIMTFVLWSNEDLLYASMNFSGISYPMTKNPGNWSLTLNESQGNYTYKILAADMMNNTNATEIYWVYVNTINFSSSANDTQSPLLNVYSPVSTVYQSVQIPVNYVVSDNIALDRCWYVLNGINNSISGCVNTSITASVGNNIFYIFVNDTSGNVNMSNVNFSIILPPPSGGGSSSGGGGGGIYTSPVRKNVTTNATNSTNNITEPKKDGRICAQVITSATNGDKCMKFATPCGVPPNWTIVDSCPEKKTASPVTGMVAENGSWISIIAIASGVGLVTFEFVANVTKAIRPRRKNIRKSAKK